jgi:hypothetical protein
MIDPAGGDSSTPRDRKVVAAAVDAYLDSVYTALFRESDDEGRGLRGGSYGIEFTDEGMKLTLDDVRWVEDLEVGGTGLFGFGDTPNSGTLTVPGGTIDLGHEPVLDATSGQLHVTGRLDGRRFRLIVPIH